MSEARTAAPVGPIEFDPTQLVVVLLLFFVAMPLAAFFIGAINPAAIFARILGKDLSSGSGNPGATNAGRVLGVRWGVVVAALDVLKGLLPTYAALLLLGHLAAYIVGVAAVLGHVFSPFLRGRGGKGVATTLGVVLAVHPVFAGVTVVVFVVVALWGRWVAGASLAAALTLTVAGALRLLTVPVPGLAGWDAQTGVWALALGGIVIARHRANIRAWLRRRRTSGD